MPDIRRVDPTAVAGRSFCFDANVWLHLTYDPRPARTKPWRSAYGQLLKAIRQSDARLLINVLLALELTGVLTRLEFEAWHRRAQAAGGVPRGSFKDIFRSAPAFSSARVEIIRVMKHEILDLCEVLDAPSMNIAALVDKLDTEDLDFADAAHIDFCRQAGAIFVTDDVDVKKTTAAIEVWSSNPDVLKV